MKKQILLFCFLFFAMIGFAENVNITGVVTSAEDGEPLIGASVQVKGNPSQGVATDIDGNYTISVPAVHLPRSQSHLFPDQFFQSPVSLYMEPGQ